MSKKGGYVIVDLKGQSITAGTPFTLDGVTARLDRAKNKACLLSGFAIGTDEKRDVFVDLQKTEDGYVALFGQYTITIENDSVTISDGGVLLNDIVDSKGRKRFIEGDVNLSERLIDHGFTKVYGKWSLSGSHLMIVFACNIANETVVSFGDLTANINLPEWVKEKIFTSISNYVEVKTAVALKDDLSSGGNVSYYLRKDSGNVFVSIASYTASANVYVRFSFDLLIDTD